MAVAVTGHQTSTSGFGTSSNSFSFTIPAGSNFLLVFDTGHWATPASATPALYITVGGMGMNLLPSSFFQQTFSQIAIWYMCNPPTGAQTIASQYPNTANLQYCLQGAIAFSGINTGNPFYKTATAQGSGSSANQSITTGSSITSNDLYLAVYQALSTTSSAQSGQTTIYDINSSDASLEQRVDTIAGSTSNPTFTFTSSSNNGNTNNSVAAAIQLQGALPNLAPGMYLGLPVGSAAIGPGVAWVQTITGWSGATTATSASTTIAAGDAVILWGGSQFTGDPLTASASIDGSIPVISAGTGHVTQPDRSNTLWSGVVGQYFHYDVSASAQTYTITSGFSSPGVVGLGWDYTGVGFVEVSSFPVVSPGTGVGAISTGPIVVPDHGILLSLCIDNGQTTNVISNVNGTQRGVGSIQANSGGYPITYCAAEFPGTGVAVTPQFTTTKGTDAYWVFNFLLHPSNSFGAGWNSSAMDTFLSGYLYPLLPNAGVTLISTQSLDDGGSSFFTTKTFNITVPTGCTCLVYFHGSADGSGGAYCTSASYNGSSLTIVSGTQVDTGGNFFGSTIAYLMNPTIGTNSFTVNVATNANANGNTFYAPCFGYFKNVSSVGGGTTNAGTSGATATITVSGLSSASDMYIANTADYCTTMSQGTNMTSIVNQTMANGATTTMNACSSIPGNDTGSFTFTGGGTTNNGWVASGCWLKH